MKIASRTTPEGLWGHRPRFEHHWLMVLRVQNDLNIVVCVLNLLQAVVINVQTYLSKATLSNHHLVWTQNTESWSAS